MSDDEVARHYPCDDHVPLPTLQAWRGVTVEAPPEDVWPWVGQIRLAPYSYDWIDNLGRRSPQQLQKLPEPVVGEAFSKAAGRPLGRILDVASADHLTARIMGSVMSYVLVPTGDCTRLLLKIVMAKGSLIAPFVSIGDLVMARRQLLNLKHLAEKSRQT